MPLREWARLAFPRDAKEKILVAIAAFLDDSGDDASRFTAICGVASEIERWEAFDLDWREILKEYGIKSIHMKKFRHREEGRYKLLPIEDWEDCFTRLCIAIMKHVRFICCCVIDNAVYKAMKQAFPKDELFKPTAYTFIGKMCIGGIARWATKAGDMRPIRFVHEIMANNKPAIQLFEAFTEMRTHNNVLASRFGGLCFEPKGSSYLQVADVLAHTIFVSLSKQWRACREDNHIRRAVRKVITDVPFEPVIFDKKTLEERRQFEIAAARGNKT